MRIVLATGGSGGHIFPALRTAAVLKAQGHDVVFAGSLAFAADKIKAQGFEVYSITSEGLLGRSPMAVVRFSSVTAGAVIKSVHVLKLIRPEYVVGFGGYGSFPVIAASRVLKIPSMIHEQNVVPGKANKLMAKLASKIAVSFKDSLQHFPSSKVVWTGCPCHCESPKISRDAIYSKLELDPSRKTIVLLGGSQGSQKLNEVFCAFMRTSWQGLGLQAVHMTGKKDYNAYQNAYEGMPVKVCEFVHNIEEIYAIADVVVGRAGAATISELGVLGIPSILVPYPFAGNHQKYNAQVLTNAGVASMIEQKDLTVDSLQKALENILNEGKSREGNLRKTKDLFSANAANQLAAAIVQRI